MHTTFDDAARSETASINFQKRFGARRKALQLSQRDLADLVGVSVNTIQSYEQGNLPRGQHFLDVAKALKCSINWLIGMNDQGECLPIYVNDLRGSTDLSADANSTARLESPASLFRPQWLELEQETSIVNSQIGLGFPRHWLVSQAIAPENVRLINVNGAAMAPTLNNGDLALIDLGSKSIRQTQA